MNLNCRVGHLEVQVERSFLFRGLKFLMSSFNVLEVGIFVTSNVGKLKIRFIYRFTYL